MVDPLELIGYVASFFVAVSLLMSSFLALRILNLVGAVVFVVYGALLGSIPVVLTNGFIAVIDVYFLVRMLRPDLNGVRYLPITANRRGQLDDFVDVWQEDIQLFFPDFSEDRLEQWFANGGSAYLAMKDLQIVGFAMVHPVPRAALSEGVSRDDSLDALYGVVRADLYPEYSVVIPLDYVVRRYRGLGLVQHLHEEILKQNSEEIRFLLAPVHRRATRHRRFLERTGYAPVAENTEYQLFGRSL